MKKIFFVVFLLLNAVAHAQLMGKKPDYSRADTLRGMLSPLRTCYDINYYHLDLKIDIDKKFISGSNEFVFTATENFSRLQFDLFSNLKIDKIIFEGIELPFTREYNAVFITFPRGIKKASKESFTVFYSGNPVIAKNPP